MSAARAIALVALTMASFVALGADAGPREGIEVWGGWNRLAMSNANDTLSSFNREFQTRLAPIHGGAGAGVALRLWPHPDYLLRLGAEKLFASSRSSDVEFELGAYALTLGVTRFVTTPDRLRWGAGLGVGPIFAKGMFEAPGATMALSGTGFQAQITSEAFVPLGPSWSLGAMAGHRWATVGGVKFGERRSDLDVEYSGFFLRVGVAVDRDRSD